MIRRPLASVSYRAASHDVEVSFLWPDEQANWRNYQAPLLSGYARLCHEVPLRPRLLSIPIGSLAISQYFLDLLYGPLLTQAAEKLEAEAARCEQPSDLEQLGAQTLFFEPEFTPAQVAAQAVWQLGHAGVSPYVRLSCQALSEQALNHLNNEPSNLNDDEPDGANPPP